MDISNLKKECGVYIIKNNINDYVYIGSSNNIYTRIKSHKHLLKKNKHYNTHLQNFVNKYGLDVLSADVLTYCCVEEQFILEENFFNDYPNKFNILTIANNVPIGIIGNKDIAIKKLIEYNKTKPKLSLEYYNSLEHTFKKGEKFDDEFLNKMRIGKILSNNNFSTLDEAIAFKKKIFNMSAEGINGNEIAKILNKNQSTIQRILSGKIWYVIKI